MVFQNIKKNEKLYVRIAEEIKNTIVNGILKPGDKLPPEREIAAQLGVSRPSVREALAVLEILGVVEIRVGDGSYVKEKPVNFNLEIEELKQSSPFELIEARYLIEALVVELAIERASEDHIAALQNTIDAMKRSMEEEKYLGEFFSQGIRFHSELALAINNEVLMRIAENLVSPEVHPLWKLLNQKVLLSKEARLHQILEHEEILEAIKTKNKEKAKSAMLHHLKHLEDMMLS